jgi:hypothetical protein
MAALVNSGNGATVDPRRPDQIAAAIIAILTERATWERLSAGALQTIETDWNWDRSAEGAEQAYAYVNGVTPDATPTPARTITLPLTSLPTASLPLTSVPRSITAMPSAINLDPLVLPATPSAHETTLVPQ